MIAAHVSAAASARTLASTSWSRDRALGDHCTSSRHSLQGSRASVAVRSRALHGGQGFRLGAPCRDRAHAQPVWSVANAPDPLQFTERHKPDGSASRIPDLLGSKRMVTDPAVHIGATRSSGRANRVIITGSTKGIGHALTEQFLAAGDSVCVTSRSTESVDEVVRELRQRYGADGVTIVGVACDVRNPTDVAKLARFAQEHLGGVDIWINNAGSNGYAYRDLVDTSPEVIKEIIDTNVYGTLICSREAIALMAAQPSGGHVFNMEGAGSDGNPTRQYASYGFSKAGMAQLAKSLTDETREGEAPVSVHTLSPGLVYTELLKAGRYTFGRNGRFFINAVAEDPATVASDLVPRMRAFVANPVNARTAGAIKYLTADKAIVKLYNRLARGHNKNRFFLENDPEDNTVTRLRLEWAPGLEPAAEKLIQAIRYYRSVMEPGQKKK